MSRNLAYWEAKLEQAEQRRTKLQLVRHRALAQLRYTLIRLKRLKTGSMRQFYRHKADSHHSQIAYCDRLIAQITTTRIPYYREQIQRGPRSSWERLRTGDGLSL